MYTLSAPRPADSAAIETLLDASFGADRLAKTSYRFREGVAPVAELSLLAREGGQLVGSIAYWPVTVREASALLLGPLGIAPDRQGRGIGRLLMGTSLRRARALGHGVVLLVGGEDYYGRFGFVPALAHGIVMAGEPMRLLARELLPGALDLCRGAVRPRRHVRPAA